MDKIQFNNRRQMKKATSVIVSVLRFALVFGLAFIIIQPIIIKLSKSFMSPEDLLDPMVQLFPQKFNIYYFLAAWKGLKLSESLLNSVLITLVSGILQTLSCVCIGYGLARFKFKGQKLALFMVVLLILIPPSTISVSQYLYFRFFRVFFWTFNTIDSIAPMIVLSICGLGLKNGMFIFLFRQFFKNMPSELENAAYVDGAGPIRAFIKIMLPNALVMMGTVFMFAVCWQWTDVHFSSLFYSQKQLLPQMIQGIKMYAIGSSSIYDAVSTGIAKNTACLILLLPVVTLFIYFQKQLVNSIAHSGIAN